MTPVQTIVTKELRSFFVSPVVYVIAAIFLTIVGLLAYWAVANASNQALRLMQIQNTYAQLNLNDMLFRPLFRSMNLVLMLILPLLTMRLFAEERKLRTFELLLTSPIGVNEIVSGKFLSVLLVYAGLLSLTGLIPITLSAYLTLWMLGALGTVAGDTPMGQILSYVSFTEHYERLIRGLLNLKDILYYLSGIAFMWYAAHQAVDAYRWK